MWNPLFVFRIADDDKDGKLSSEEVIAHYDTFVGSQATGYIRFFIDCLNCKIVFNSRSNILCLYF